LKSAAPVFPRNDKTTLSVGAVSYRKIIYASSCSGDFERSLNVYRALQTLKEFFRNCEAFSRPADYLLRIIPPIFNFSVRALNLSTFTSGYGLLKPEPPSWRFTHPLNSRLLLLSVYF
jgi:hypothetical protein